MKVNKYLINSLFIAILLSSCGSYSNYKSDNCFYENYVEQNIFVRENNSFEFNLIDDVFKDGKILDDNDNLIDINYRYDDFQLYYGNTVDKENDIKPCILSEINNFKCRVKAPNQTSFLYGRFLNHTKQYKSKLFYIGVVHVEKDYKKINSVEDLYKISTDYENYTCFILNNDIDFNGFEIAEPIEINRPIIFRNPYKYTIKNINFYSQVSKVIDKGHVKLIDGFSKCYYDGLIFENIVCNFDNKKINSDEIYNFSLFGNSSYTSFNNIKVSNLYLKSSYNPIKYGTILLDSYRCNYTNNYVDIYVDVNTSIYNILSSAGGLACNGKGYYLYHDEPNMMDEVSFARFNMKQDRIPIQNNVIKGLLTGNYYVGGIFGKLYSEDKNRKFIDNTIDIELHSASTKNVGPVVGVVLL